MTSRIKKRYGRKKFTALAAWRSLLGNIFSCALFFIPLFCAAPLAGAACPCGLDIQPAKNASELEARFDEILNVPYRTDGAINCKGEYATFMQPDKALPGPGFNCSGFVLQSSRLAFGRDIAIEDARRDRAGNSGPNAPFGEDWDFGLDLVLNVSEGLPRRWIMPGGSVLAVENTPWQGDILNFRGYDLHNPGTLAELMPRVRQGKIYLLSFSRPVAKAPYKLLHYHVGFLWRDADNKAWFYHAAPGSGKSYRMGMNTPEELREFLQAFKGSTQKSILALEVDLPQN